VHEHDLQTIQCLPAHDTQQQQQQQQQQDPVSVIIGGHQVMLPRYAHGAIHVKGASTQAVAPFFIFIKMYCLYILFFTLSKKLGNTQGPSPMCWCVPCLATPLQPSQ
jgi:hypothetical protein